MVREHNNKNVFLLSNLLIGVEGGMTEMESRYVGFLENDFFEHGWDENDLKFCKLEEGSENNTPSPHTEYVPLHMQKDDKECLVYSIMRTFFVYDLF